MQILTADQMELPTPPRSFLNQRQKKRRDNWENELNIAKYQAKTLKDNLRMFENNLSNVLRRYEDWLVKNNAQPQVNLELYRNI